MAIGKDSIQIWGCTDAAGPQSSEKTDDLMVRMIYRH